MLYNEKSVILKDGREILLKTAEIEDAGKLLDFLIKCSSETDYILRNESESRAMSLESEIDFIKNARNSDSTMMISCYFDGKIIGNCSFNYVPLSKVRHRATVAIGILKDFWGVGLGTVMMNELFVEAKKCGIEIMQLEYVDGNERAAGLYQKCGFVKFAERPDAVKMLNGETRKDIWMMKYL